MANAKARYHWLAPTVMLGAFAAGIAFAVGHHFFYQYLDGRRLSAGLIIPYVSSQEVNLAAGTAFAFLVRACLVLAISVVFIQVFWRGLLNVKEQGQKLGDIDDSYSTSANFFMLFHPLMWWRYPLLLVVGLIGWLVPIASIFTPATLSIQSSAQLPPPASVQHVPNIDMRSFSYLESLLVEYDPTAGRTLGLYYRGPSTAVQTIASSVLATGDILPIEPPALNSSWELQFNGPQLKCKDLSSSFSYASYLAHRHALSQYTYLAWYPEWDPSQSNSLNDSMATSIPIWNSEFHHNSIWNTRFMEAYVALFPFNHRNSTSSHLPNSTIAKETTLLGCQILNATYHVSFAYTNGVQNITHSLTPIDEHAIGTVNQIRHSDCTKATQNCWNDFSLLPKLCYQAVADAFFSFIVGSLGPESAKTQILETALRLTWDITRVSTEGWTPSYRGEHIAPGYNTNGIYTGTLPQNAMSVGTALPLAEAMEQLFQNFTISLIASADLQPNSSSITAPPPVNVTHHPVHNVYVYSAWKLGTAYGIAIALCLIVVGIGLFSIVTNKACYSDNFSSIFRAARGADVKSPLQEKDLNGSDPLPAYIAKTRVQIHRERQAPSAQALLKRPSQNGDDHVRSRQPSVEGPALRPQASIDQDSAGVVAQNEQSPRRLSVDQGQQRPAESDEAAG